MLVALSPLGGAGTQFFDANGSLLVGGRLYTYAAGTTTPLATYTDSTGNTAHTNPIELDSTGRVPGGAIWLAMVGYKFVLTDANDSLIATWDGIRNADATTVPFAPPVGLGFGAGTDTVKEALVDLANAATTNTPVGSIVMYGGVTVPTGFLLCDGSVKAATDYPELYVALGSTFDTGGEGTGNFRLPDLRGRFPIGTGTGAGLTDRVLGDKGGEETHVLTEGELAQHYHLINSPNGPFDEEQYFVLTRTDGGGTSGYGVLSPGVGASLPNALLTEFKGNNEAHNNMPPFLGLNFIIKT